MQRKAPKKVSGPKTQVIKGKLVATGLRFGIVVSTFNEALTLRLLEGCVDELIRHGAAPRDIVTVWVPGAFEIPLAAQELIRHNKKIDAVITLSVVIGGQTRHFDQVVRETAKGIRELAQRSQKPVILGMIPASNIQDALERTGIKHRSKGREWALAAIESANLMTQLKIERLK